MSQGYGGGNIDSANFRQLIVRWFQWGAFCPVRERARSRPFLLFPLPVRSRPVLADHASHVSLTAADQCAVANEQLFRNHGARSGGPDQGNSGTCGGTGGSNEIWNFGAESEGAIAKVMMIREQLRPYVMEQYATASATGAPIMRPLFYGGLASAAPHLAAAHSPKKAFAWARLQPYLPPAATYNAAGLRRLWLQISGKMGRRS
eukprot:SAG22_NODE_7_length_40155_cov_25.241356_25_plen_204_part_00